MPTIRTSMHAESASAVPTVDGAHRRTSEDGFSLVELLVAIIIIGILMAMVISTFRGPKTATYFKVATATALNYSDAVEAYMADNGQIAPTMGANGTWAVDPKFGRDRGPRDVMLQNGFYMRSVPEPITDGAVDLVGPGETPKSEAQFSISYTSTGSAYTFRIAPVTKGDPSQGDPTQAGGDSEAAQFTCIITNRPDLAPGEKRC